MGNFFQLAQGYGVVTVGRQQFTLTFPYFSDGKFKAILIGIDGMFVRVLVDYIHEKVNSLEIFYAEKFNDI